MKLLIFMFILFSCYRLSANDSLLGSDKDKNGVRDDVDAFIGKHFKGQNSINAAKQHARYFTSRLLNKDDREKLLNVIDKLDESYDCYGAVNPGKKRAHRDLEKIAVVILNTKERVIASSQATRTLGVAAGNSKDYNSPKYCEFKIQGK